MGGVDDELDIEAMIARFQERARHVRERPLPPVAGPERHPVHLRAADVQAHPDGPGEPGTGAGRGRAGRGEHAHGSAPRTQQRVSQGGERRDAVDEAARAQQGRATPEH